MLRCAYDIDVTYTTNALLGDTKFELFLLYRDKKDRLMVKKYQNEAIEHYTKAISIAPSQEEVEKIELDLVHVHPQNPAPVINNIPSQLEITFSTSPKKISDKITLPHKLDHPANPNFKDIELKFKEY